MEKRLTAWLLALILAAALVPDRGWAVLNGVYITAVNEKLMPLAAETMPFWSDGTLYVSNKMFEGTDLGVTYVRNNIMNLAVLYTPRTDLRFDLNGEGACDKQGVSFDASVIEKGDYVFFPLDMVCKYFGLKWSYNETDTVPLIRVTSDSSQLDDVSFIDAAARDMRSRYTAYEKLVSEQHTDPVVNDDPPVHAAAGQKIYLIVDSGTPEDTRAAMEKLGEAQATFLLTAEQMENGDLVRGLVAGGHAVALRLTGETEDDLEAEIQRGRDLCWQAACVWLDLVWYEGEMDLASLLTGLGCREVTAQRDENGAGLASAGRARALLRTVGRYREDLSIFLGSDSGCLGGLETLMRGLETAQYSVCAWRHA